jgi:hypothetical protein
MLRSLLFSLGLLVCAQLSFGQNVVAPTVPHSIAQPSGTSLNAPSGNALRTERLNKILIVDGLKYTTIQSALDAAGSTGGTVFVPAGTPFDTMGIKISHPVRLIFDQGTFTFGGTGTAITVSSTAGSGIMIEGSASGDENLPLRGTAISVTKTAATGLDLQSCPSCIIQDIGFVGPGSGTGVGARLSGNGFIMRDVEVDRFGGDGVWIDGARANTNSFVIERVKSHSNGGRGFFTNGINSNLGTWIATSSISNVGTQYVFRGTSAHAFVAVHAQPSTDVATFVFAASGDNWGSVYTEPISPFRANVVTFDAASVNNYLQLFNGRKVSDLGTGNLIFFGAGDAGTNISGWYQGIRQTVPSNVVDSVFAPVSKIERFGASSELTQDGIFFKSRNFFSGYEKTGAASLNFIYNTSGSQYHTRFFNNCAGDISECTPVLDLDGNGNSVFSGHVNQSAANSDKAGVLTCSGSTATKTFATAYMNTPVILLTDDTTKGGANITAKSASGFTISCTGATDVAEYMVIGNPK